MGLGSLFNGCLSMLPDLSELPMDLSENCTEHETCFRWHELPIPRLILSPTVVHCGQ
jgi:hypothetical protein